MQDVRGPAAPGWDITVPSDPRRLAGVSMAGFSGRTTDAVDLHVVPFPAVTLFVDLGDAQVVNDQTGECFAGTGVIGLAPIRVRSRARDLDCLQLRLSPVVAHAVFGCSFDLSGTVVDLDALWGREAGRFRERLHAQRTWASRFETAEATLTRRLQTRYAVEREVVFAWRRMLASRGRVRVEQLATELGWSRKRLWSRFRSQLGITPKRATQLIRFDHAAHRLAAGHAPAAVAADTGYADQSHLHRDALSFAGLTPTAVASAPWLAVDDVAWRSPVVRRQPGRRSSAI